MFPKIMGNPPNHPMFNRVQHPSLNAQKRLKKHILSDSKSSQRITWTFLRAPGKASQRLPVKWMSSEDTHSIGLVKKKQLPVQTLYLMWICYMKVDVIWICYIDMENVDILYLKVKMNGTQIRRQVIRLVLQVGPCINICIWVFPK